MLRRTGNVKWYIEMWNVKWRQKWGVCKADVSAIWNWSFLTTSNGWRCEINYLKIGRSSLCFEGTFTITCFFATHKYCAEVSRNWAVFLRLQMLLLFDTLRLEKVYTSVYCNRTWLLSSITHPILLCFYVFHTASAYQFNAVWDCSSTLSYCQL